MDRTILTLLAENEFVSGEKISESMGISRSAVWKKINSLREEGFDITSQGKKGYHLNMGDRLEQELWQNMLTTKRLGRAEAETLQTTDSTNSQLKRMALMGAAEGSICTAEEQTRGKGRLGRVWESPQGAGLWLSVLLRPEMKPERAPVITLAAAIAMAEAIRKVAGAEAKIKWPNDIVVDGRKICGILLEISAEMDMVEYVIVGTGVNFRKTAYSDELRDKAVSIEEVCSAVPKRREIMAEYLNLLEKLMDIVAISGFEGIRERYEAMSATLGKRVQVTGSVNVTGTAENVDSEGCLMVRDDEGTLHRILSGDVSVRGVMGYA